jgi:hypothetical protein
VRFWCAEIAAEAPSCLSTQALIRSSDDDDRQKTILSIFWSRPTPSRPE